MTRRIKGVPAVLRPLLAGAFALLLHGGLAAADEPSVLARTAPLKQVSVSSTLPSYGSIHLDTREALTVSFPRAGIVARLMVTQGQVVRKGDRLVEFRTAPAEAMAYKQAKLALEYAGKDLERTKQLLQRHLATRADLSAAEKALEDARAGLKAQAERNAGKKVDVSRAPFGGIVTAISAKQGDEVAAGTAILQLARAGKLWASLGVEPEDIHRVKVGMPVRIRSVFDRSLVVKGRVSAVHGVINQQTRLVDVEAVVLGSGGSEDGSTGDRPAFIPDMQVLGEIVTSARTAWVVPRSAVLRDGNGAYLFQVDGGRARRVAVTTAEETKETVAIEGPFDPSLPVVVTGNYELGDGMAVREEFK